MNPVFLLTAAGHILGCIGWFADIEWLFWVGVALCALTLFLNLASGVMKLPVLPALFMIVAAFLLGPWYVGLGVGLLAWTAVEAGGEVIGMRRARPQ
jgi:hypothetical protein